MLIASATINVHPRVIDWIINRIQNENVDSWIIEQLRSWRDLVSIPTYTEIETLSKRIHIPFGTFFLHQPPVEDKYLEEFRTINNGGNEYYSLNLEDTLKKMMSIQSWMIDYKKLGEEKPLNFIGLLSVNNNYQTSAKIIRDKLNLKLDWNTKLSSPEDLFEKIRELFQNSGILFMKNKFVEVNIHPDRELDTSEFRAFTLYNELAPLIFINQNDNITGQVFSSLHELVHLFLGINSLFSGSDSPSQSATEKYCNRVTAELLIPESLIKKEWKKSSQVLLTKVNNLAKLFNVSSQLIVFRAVDLNLINDIEANQILKLTNQNSSKIQIDEEDKNYQEFTASIASRQMSCMDINFLKALKKSIEDDETSYTEAMHLTNSDGKRLFELLEEVN